MCVLTTDVCNTMLYVSCVFKLSLTNKLPAKGLIVKSSNNDKMPPRLKAEGVIVSRPALPGIVMEILQADAK